MKKSALRQAAWIVLICFGFLTSGCATLTKEQYEKYGYKGNPVVKEGRRILPIDWLGNLMGIEAKLLIFNWKIERHRITEPTKEAVERYLGTHPELGYVYVQLNRWAPVDAFRRLFKNKGVKWPYRYTIGFIEVLLFDVLLYNRIFGGDNYNPYTHTVNIHSDLPSVALHELGHAEDFAGRRYRGSYALFRMVPFVDLNQEYKASRTAIEYAQHEKLYDTELEAYKVLYPAFGTYIGGYMIFPGFILAVIAGHIIGRRAASDRKAELKTLHLL